MAGNRWDLLTGRTVAPRAHERSVGSVTKVSDLVALNETVELSLRDSIPKRVQASYSIRPDRKVWRRSFGRG